MKKQILIMAMLMVTLVAAAKDLKTLRVRTEPPMVCNNCENKIKKNIRFEKGIHEISTDLEGQVVTVVYDADKTDEEKIVKAFDKIKYKATILGDNEECNATKSCGQNNGNCCKAKENKCETQEKKCCKKDADKCKETVKETVKECCKKEGNN